MLYVLPSVYSVHYGFYVREPKWVFFLLFVWRWLGNKMHMNCLFTFKTINQITQLCYYVSELIILFPTLFTLYLLYSMTIIVLWWFFFYLLQLCSTFRVWNWYFSEIWVLGYSIKHSVSHVSFLVWLGLMFLSSYFSILS